MLKSIGSGPKGKIEFDQHSYEGYLQSGESASGLKYTNFRTQLEEDGPFETRTAVSTGDNWDILRFTTENAAHGTKIHEALKNLSPDDMQTLFGQASEIYEQQEENNNTIDGTWTPHLLGGV